MFCSAHTFRVDSSPPCMWWRLLSGALLLVCWCTMEPSLNVFVCKSVCVCVHPALQTACSSWLQPRLLSAMFHAGLEDQFIRSNSAQEHHCKSPADTNTCNWWWYRTWSVWRTCIVMISNIVSTSCADPHCRNCFKATWQSQKPPLPSWSERPQAAWHGEPVFHPSLNASSFPPLA